MPKNWRKFFRNLRTRRFVTNSRDSILERLSQTVLVPSSPSRVTMEDFHRRRRRFWIAQAKPAFTPFSNISGSLSTLLSDGNKARANDETTATPTPARSPGFVKTNETLSSSGNPNLFRDPTMTPSLRRRQPEFRDPRATLFQESPTKTPINFKKDLKNNPNLDNEIKFGSTSVYRQDLDGHYVADNGEVSKDQRHRRKKSRKLIKKAL